MRSPRSFVARDDGTADAAPRPSGKAVEIKDRLLRSQRASVAKQITYLGINPRPSRAAKAGLYDFEAFPDSLDLLVLLDQAKRTNKKYR